ncbi:hypothetical protein BDQ17DRAFT_1424171 [Cyathus striatus]|nr:hypothetical protein BDQ17DRAFT_1424171 [Cyathus striatus]
MSTTFYRTILPTSWAISLGMLAISRFLFQPRTNSTPRYIPRPWDQESRPSKSAKKINPSEKPHILRPGFLSNFHPRALNLLKAANRVLEMKKEMLIITNEPSNTLSMVITDSEGKESTMRNAYHNMNRLLQERHNEGSLGDITELDISIPWTSDSESINALARVPVGSGTIAKPKLTSFTWSGTLLLLPDPWQTLPQFDFSAIVKLSLTECEVTVQDCLFIFCNSPEMKQFTAMSISAGLKEFAVIPTSGSPERIEACRMLSHRSLLGISNVWWQPASNLQTQCTKLEYIAVGTCVNVKPLWDALASCNQINTIYLKSSGDCAERNVTGIPWNKRYLRKVIIATQEKPEEVNRWMNELGSIPSTIDVGLAS